MSSPLKLCIIENDKVAVEVPLSGPLEVGRQKKGEPEPYTLLPGTGSSPTRLVIARQKESNCSRRHLLLQPLPSGSVRVTNRSEVPVPHSGAGASILRDGSEELTAPFQLKLASRTLAVSTRDSIDEPGLWTLNEQTVAPGNPFVPGQTKPALPALSAAQLDWLQKMTGVLQSATGSADFLERAAQALVQIVGLDSGRVLLLEGERWKVEAVFPPDDGRDWQPNQRVLERIRKDKGTFWQAPKQYAVPDPTGFGSMQGPVASPLLNGRGEVIGALYGEPRAKSLPSPWERDKLEAVLVEMLACGISSGLARRQHEQAALKAEKEAIEARVQFEQFFTPQLARQLQREPKSLESREAAVTLLFCDIQGFSRISEKLGAAATVDWLFDVMGELSQCVLDQEGVLVDYIGDELLAMWGAPQEQPDQAIRAASAAVAILDTLEKLNQRWQPQLGAPMSCGIGLNTGPAHVGNTGSRHKFKYGPLGNNVNLASRVQGMTKYLKCRLLVTAATRRQLDDKFIARRVCRARVVNIDEPVDLYEVEAKGSQRRRVFFQESEEALDALEGRDFAHAARAAGTLLLDQPADGPVLLVLSRAAQQLMAGSTTFDPVWVPPGK